MRTHHCSLVSALLILFATSSFAANPIARINTYEALLQALTQGHRVSVVADASECKLAKLAGAATKADPDLTAVMGLGFNNNFFLKIQDPDDNSTSIATIATNTITGAPGDVYRYKRIRIFKNDKFHENEAEWFASVSNFNNGTLIASITMLCSLDNPRAISLFDYDAGR